MVRNGAGVTASRRAARFGALAMALAMAGCSADIARFDSPYFGLNDGPAAAPPPSRSLGGPTSLAEQQPDPGSGGAYFPPSSGRTPSSAAQAPAVQGSGQGVRLSALPEPSSPVSANTPSPTRAPAAAASQPARTQAPIARGETIDVQQGDTLYSIAKKHNVSIAELSSVNNLTGPMIRPGQKLVLPASVKTTPAVAAGAAKPAGPALTVPPAAAAPAVDQPGTYTMRSGDSLYAVARKNKVTLEQLKSANGITDERRIRVGTVLKLPGVDTGTPPAAAAKPVPAPAPAPVVAAPAVEPAAPSLSTKPTIINSGPKQVAALDRTETATDAPPVALSEPAKPKGAEAASAATKFRWPAKGKIVSSFGQRADGTHNDGVDIAVPLGAEVLAAEAGVVAYAGNELKGFGNLVLLRHDNGWVTAYAHNDALLVKRGDKVRRGQPLAKAGKSGSVDQPTVHFEIRQGSKPVDPVPLLEKL